MRRKSGSLIYRYNSVGIPELLVFNFADCNDYYRLPGGSVEDNETFFEGILREVEEESGITELTFLRSIGKTHFYKPYIKTSVIREDFLFYCNQKLPSKWTYKVQRDGEDKDEAFIYKWITNMDFEMIDPELKTLLFYNNVPELYIYNHAFGLESGKLGLSEYCNDWLNLYEFEKNSIFQALEGRIIAIEHIGSTSINGMISKPIIDIGISVSSFESAFDIIEPLRQLGYIYHGENGILGRHYFTKGNPCFYHVHCLGADSQEWENHIKFRDTLNNHNELKQEYALIKTSNLKNCKDRQSYQTSKSKFINKVIGTHKYI